MNKRPKLDLTDAENPQWTAKEARAAVPFMALPVGLQAKLRGRPKAAVTKEPVKLRLDADVLAALRELAKQGTIDKQLVADAIVRFGIDTNKPNPLFA